MLSSTILSLLSVISLVESLPVATTFNSNLIPKSRAVKSIKGIRTTRGFVTGSNSKNISLRYVVPYASQSRFENSVSLPTNSTSTIDGTKLAPLCPQDGVDPSNYNEDCLFLTIHTPNALPPNVKASVLVWIHGGSFIAGGSTPDIDGSFLASSGIIVVVVQYRLGVLGFLHSTDMGIQGNLGVRDVIQALQYIKEEISAFGGDSNRVLLAGHSSGAEIIKTLLVTPSAQNLFTRAALHSVPLSINDQPIAVADSISKIYGKNVNCDDKSCLKSLSIDSILSAQVGLYSDKVGVLNLSLTPIHTTIEPALAPIDFSQAVSTGTITKSIMFTSMASEACQVVESIFPYAIPTSNFNDMVSAVYPKGADALIASNLYTPPSTNDGTRSSLIKMATDSIWTCPIQQSAVNLSSNNNHVYLAEIEFFNGISHNTNSLCVQKAGHQDDIYPLFNTFPTRPNQAQAALSSELRSRWLNFAMTGEPNVLNDKSKAIWQPIKDENNLNMLRFATTSRSNIVQTQRTAACSIWGKIASS